MNREILFRGLAIDGFWVYFDIEKSQQNPFFGSVNFKINSETVGQFTGMTDKNRIKIFEGDIYHMGDKDITYTVVWHDSGFIGKQNGTRGSYAGLEHWKYKIQVIGNIFEKQELK